MERQIALLHVSPNVLDTFVEGFEIDWGFVAFVRTLLRRPKSTFGARNSTARGVAALAVINGYRLRPVPGGADELPASRPSGLC